MDLIQALMETGLTRHEARLFALLSSEGAMSGYEAAKLTGMSRSNAYMALSGLADKGGALRIEGDVVLYEAVPAHEYAANKRRYLADVLRTIEQDMPHLRSSVQPYLTIRGRRHILDKIRNMVDQARERVYILLPIAELRQVLPELSSLKDRGGKVVILTAPPFTMNDVTVHHRDARDAQVRLIVDSSEILSGEIGTSAESTCLYSRDDVLVGLFKEAMKNEINLIELKQEKRGKTT